mmetsp:Transcript_29586/g.40644  ORF Transcript_29586/g.40644 Transcript_29586/m.40644 type:complete len:160 (-) Transcript_29586:987-1466(-)
MKTNLSAQNPSFIVILQSILFPPTPTQIFFITVCNSKSYKSPIIANYTCSDSGRVLFHNCTNRIGIMKSYCPVYKPSCVDTSNNGQSSCVLLSHTSTETICECSISVAISVEKGRKLVNEVATIAEESGVVMQLVAVSEYVSADFFKYFHCGAEFEFPK